MQNAETILDVIRTAWCGINHWRAARRESLHTRFGEGPTEKARTSGTSPAAYSTRRGADGKGQGNLDLASGLPYAIRRVLGRRVEHRTSRYLNNRMEQDHRGVKQRYYPMRGFGNVQSASRFCSAFDEQRDYFRYRSRPKQTVPLAEQRLMFRQRFSALRYLLMAA